MYCLEDISNHMLAGGGEDGIKLWKWDELTRNTKVHHHDTDRKGFNVSIY